MFIVIGISRHVSLYGLKPFWGDVIAVIALYFSLSFILSVARSMQASIRFVLGNYHPIILVNVQARVALVL